MKGKKKILKCLLAITLSLTMVLGMIQPVQVSAVSSGTNSETSGTEVSAESGEGIEQRGNNKQPAPSEIIKTYTVEVTGPDVTVAKPGDILTEFKVLVKDNEGTEVQNPDVIWHTNTEAVVDTTNGVAVTVPTTLADSATFEIWASFRDTESNRIQIKIERPKITVSGRVLDSFTKKGEISLESAKITLISTGAVNQIYETATNKEGKYLITDVVAGAGVEFQLEVSKDGYSITTEKFSGGNENYEKDVKLTTNETITLSSNSSNEIKIFETCEITAITELKDEITWTVEPANGIVESTSAGKELSVTGVKNGEVTVTASAHGVRSDSYTITVNKRKADGKICILKDNKLLSDSNVANVGDTLSIKLELNDKKLKDEEVRFTIQTPNKDEPLLLTAEVDNKGIASVTYKVEYEGTYSVSCDVLDKKGNFEHLNVKSQFEVKGKKGQTITLKENSTENISYGDTVSYELKATVAATSAEDAQDLKHWAIADENNNSDYAPQFKFTEVVKNKDSQDLWDVTGAISFKAVCAGDVAIEVTYSQASQEEGKVYEDAVCSKTCSIKKIPLTVKSITFNEKIYDGTNDVTASEILLDGIIDRDNNGTLDDVQAVTTGLKLAGKDADEGKGYLLETEGENSQPLILEGADKDNYEIVKAENDALSTTYCKIMRRQLYLKVVDNPDGKLLQRQYGQPGVYENGAPSVRVATNTELGQAGITGTVDVGEIAVNDADIKDVTVKDDSATNAIVDNENTPDTSLQKRLKPDLNDGDSIPDSKGNNNYKYVENMNLHGSVRIIPNRTIKADAYLTYSSTNGSTYMNDKELWVRGNVDATGNYDLTLSLQNQRIKFDAIKVKGANKDSDENVQVIVPEAGSNSQSSVQVKFVMSEAQKRTAKVELVLLNNNVECSAPFVLTANVDTKAPVVSFDGVEGKASLATELVKAITFNKYRKRNYEMKVSFADTEDLGTEGSGVRSIDTWQYYVLPITNDMQIDEYSLQKAMDNISDNQWTVAKDGQDSVPIGQFDEEIAAEYIEGHYIVAVRSYDNVQNSKIYTSNGLVLEDNNPEITFKETPKTYYNLEDMKNSSNQFTLSNIEISDIAKDGDASSAIKEVSYQVYKGGTKDSKLDDSGVVILIPDFEETVLYKTEKDGYLYSDLQKDSEFTKITSKVSFAVDERYDGNDVFLRVTATDNAGNEHYNTIPLRFDLSRPEIEVTYANVGNTEVHNENYYNGNRTATIKFSDRNVDMNQAVFTLALKDKKYEQDIVLNEGNVAILKDLKDIYGNNIFADITFDMDEGTGQDEVSHTSTVTLEFNGNEQYTVYYSCTDLAGNTNAGNDPNGNEVKGLTYKTDTNELSNTTFTIDKIAPVVTQLYTSDGQEISMESKEYTQKPMFYSVNIAEHNFKADALPFEADSITTITEEVDEGKESKPDMEDVNQWTENGNLNNIEQWKFTFSFTEQGNYTHSFNYKDLAGNDAVFVDIHGNPISNKSVFTIDWTPANATVTVGNFNPWKNWFGDIFFKLFSKTSVDVSIEAQDDICDIYPLEYARFYDSKTVEQLDAYGDWQSASVESPGYTKFNVNPNERFIVYTKITDYAGNMKYYSSDGVIVDSTKPAPTVTITNLTQAQNGIFNEDVTLRIDVEDPTAGDTYSGLETVWYNVSATGNVNKGETIKLLNNSTKVQGNKTFSQTITIPSDVYNSNDVKVQAFATDFSGNKGKSEVTELKIDVTKPSISVSWDLNNPLNGRYYKDTRTATVTVTDRNFDPNNVRFNITNTDGTPANIGGWSSSSNIGVSDTATSTCQVSFPADGDYTFTLGCTDLAGNSGEYGQTDEFTIDKIVPVMTVSYDSNDAKNGNYFKETRTATITVREHNFNAADVRAAITASLEGRGISAPSVGAFSGSGDTHTAIVSYSTDGDYTFDIDYADMAGNAAADYTQDSFTVDLTVPELEITDVEDKSANNDAVSPKVEATDVNYDAKGVTVTLIGANNGEVEIGTVVSAIENGQSMKFNDFERTEEMDDLYKMTAKAVDKAGNETEKEIMFSVNRYGSVFILDDDTKDWLKTGDAGYTYIKEEKAVGIREINVDAIESRSITVNRDGDLQNLKENTDFTVKNSGSDAQWKEAHYILDKENFAEEGNYTVILNTKDKAKNNMNNTSVKKANKNLPIEFAVDKTAPTVVVSGVEDDAQYRAAERIMTVDAKDNLALTKVTVDIDGTETVYEGEELLKDNGVIETAVESANRWQNIEITAEDAAGNILGQSEETMKGEPVVLRVLVTPNIMIQYFMNKPIFYGSIAAVVAMTGLIIFLIWKKRKDDEERSAGK